MAVTGRQPTHGRPPEHVRAHRWRRNSGEGRANCRGASSGCAIVVVQEPTKPFLAADRSLLTANFLALSGEQQHVSFALMVSLLMIMDLEFGEDSAQRRLAQQDYP